MPAYQIGDRVRLNSGGHELTVVDNADVGPDGEVITVALRNGRGIVKEFTWPAAMVKPADSQVDS